MESLLIIPMTLQVIYLIESSLYKRRMDNIKKLKEEVKACNVIGIIKSR